MKGAFHAIGAPMSPVSKVKIHFINIERKLFLQDIRNFTLPKKGFIVSYCLKLILTALKMSIEIILDDV